MSISLKEILEDSPVEASAPCRIDSGGTWDIKAMALPFEHVMPATVNIALNLRTRVTLSPFDDHKIRITSQGFPRGETYNAYDVPLASPYGIFLAAISHFDFRGMALHIRSDSPIKSAMGGSSTALVALIKAFDKIGVRLGRKKLTLRDILHLSYHLEDSVSGGNCGLQDQAAAVYGGVNLWTWRYGNPAKPFDRTPLMSRKEQGTLSDHLAVAFTGTSHVSSRTNRKWLADFLSGKTRNGWLEVNQIVREFARELRANEWTGAARILKEETALRRKLTPEALIPTAETLIRQAEQAGCGARFTGAGAGGAVWGIGEQGNIERVRESWRSTLAFLKGASVLNCRVDRVGVA